MLGLSAPERVLARIDRSELLRKSLTQRRKAFNGGSVLSATLNFLNSSAQAAEMRSALGPPAHLQPAVRRQTTMSFLRSQAMGRDPSCDLRWGSPQVGEVNAPPVSSRNSSAHFPFFR